MWEFKKNSLWVLYDPDRLSPEEFWDKVSSFGDKVNAILVGTTFLERQSCDKVKRLKQLTELPLILFPGSSYQVCEHYDYVLFLSLISGRNPEYLIGEHVKAAPMIKRMGLKVIPTAYVLIDGGSYTSTEFITNSKPIPRNKPEIVLAHCLAAKYLGFKVIYLEAGSGAILSVPYDMVSLVKREVGLPVIVGGGIRLKNQVSRYFESGADVVVVGTALEDDDWDA